MIRIEITSSDVNPRTVHSKKTGEIFNFIEQQAYLHLGNEPYPQRGRVTLPKGQTVGYAPGFYTPGPKSLYVNKYGQLEIRLSVLVPEAPAGVRKAA